MDSIALLVLDAQDSFIQTLHNKEPFLKRTAFIIEAARSMRMHTIFTEQVPDKLGRTNKQLLDLARKPKIFSKTSFSALNAPGMERYLREKEIYHLIVCGLETPICVYQTGLQAADEDIDITFLTDALGCRRQEDEAFTLQALKDLGCHLLPSEAVFYSLLGDSGNHYFRAFSNLVKIYSEPVVNLEERVMANKQSEEQRSQPGPGKSKKKSGSKSPEKKEGESAEVENRTDQREESEKPSKRKRSRRRKPKPKQDSERNNDKLEAGQSQELKDEPKDKEPKIEEPEKKKARKRVAKKTARKAAKKATKKTARKRAKPDPEKDVSEKS